MASCIIKLKTGKEYRVFDTLDQLKLYLKEHRDEVIPIEVKDKTKLAKVTVDDKEFEYLVEKNRNAAIKRIIYDTNDEAFKDTKAVLDDSEEFDDFDRVAFAKKSKVLSLSEVLQNFKRIGKDGIERRLFPEYIAQNYMNVLRLDGIIQYVLENSASTDDKKLTRSAVLGFIKESILNGETKTVPELINEIESITLGDGTKLCDAEDIDLLNKLRGNDEEIKKINEQVAKTNIDNFRIMLRGEIFHHVFSEVVSKNLGRRVTDAELRRKIKDNIVGSLRSNKEGSLRGSFHFKYDDDSSMELNDVDGHNVASEVIDEICKQTENNLVDEYIEQSLNIIDSIKAQIPGSSYTFISEKRITAKLNDGMEINGKKELRGKPDLIVVVDGVPHIIDLKCSRKKPSEWNPAKILKTEYQLEMYKRLLNRVGIDTDASTKRVACVVMEDDGKVKNITLGPLRSGYESANIKNNLDEFFSNVELGQVIEKDVFTSVENSLTDILGTVSKKGRSVMSENAIKESLKARVVRLKNGKYRISYNVFDAEARCDKYKHVDVEESELDSSIDRIAKEIVFARQNSFSLQYNSLCDDLTDWFHNNKKSISQFGIVTTSSGVDLRRLEHIQAVFMKFKNTMHNRIIRNPELERLGLIVIACDSGIEVISCTELGIDEPYDIADKKGTLFDRKSLRHDKLKKTNGNVAALKAVLIANQLTKAINKPLMGVTVMHLGASEGFTMAQKTIVEIANTLPELGITNHLQDRIADRLSIIVGMLNGMAEMDGEIADDDPIVHRKNLDSKLEALGKEKKSWIEAQFSKGSVKTTPDLTLREKIIMLEYVRDQLKLQYPEKFKGAELKTIDNITQLMVEVEKALQVYRNQEVIADKDIGKYGLSGAMLTSTDNIPNENAQLVRIMISDGLNAARMDFTNNYLPFRRSKLIKLQQYCHSSLIGRYTIENPIAVFDNLYEKQDGKLKDLILKNPFDPKVGLGEAEKEFIKFALWVFNFRKYNWKTVNDIDPMVLKPEDFRVPLIANSGLNKFRKPGEGGLDMVAFKSMGNNIKTAYDHMKSEMLESGQLFTDDTIERKKSADEFNQIYNGVRETRTNNNRREKLLSEREINYFSTDLGTILDIYYMQEACEIEFNTNVVPQIRGALLISAFNEKLTGKTQENYIEFMTKYAKNVLYGESIMSEEVQGLMKKLAPFRSAAFTIALGWNWMNVPRELLMGFFKNISIATTGFYGKETFTIQDYMKAWGLLAYDAIGFIKNVTKIEMLNEFYGMANMSITEIPEQVTDNKTGIFASFSRWMSWSLTSPDYWNRMSMFIAQMMHDGTWEAHTVEEDADGVKRLKYDITKDKRFDLLVKYRGRVEAVPKAHREKFLYQKALYEAMVDEFNRTEREQIIYKPGDMPTMPRAYTNKDRESLKSLADVSFGYYDKETKAWFFKTAVGQIFKMFLAFMSAKKCQYWQAGSDVVARGKWVELTNTKGEKVFRIINSDGSVTNKLESELTTAEREYAQPVITWEGMFIEGIFQSYGNLFKDMFNITRGVFDKSKHSKEGFRKIFNEYIKKGHIRHSNILQLWIDAFWGYIFMYLMRLLFFDNPEVTGLSYKQQLDEKSAVEQGLYWIADNASRDFQILDNIQQGFFNWDIMSFSILERSFKTFFKSAGDEDLSLAEGIIFGSVDSFGVFRPFRPVVKELRKEAKENAS